jgi:hypothetical protein
MLDDITPMLLLLERDAGRLPTKWQCGSGDCTARALPSRYHPPMDEVSKRQDPVGGGGGRRRVGRGQTGQQGEGVGQNLEARDLPGHCGYFRIVVHAMA